MIADRLRAALGRTPPAARRVAGRLFRWKGILGINYHRIGDGRRSVFDRGLWSATAEDFDRQLRYLKSSFSVISPDEIPDARSKRDRHVVVTFDDGYADNYTAAFPILSSHGLKAAFFIATSFIDAPKLPWWDAIAWMIRTSKRSTIELRDHLPPVPLDEPDRERAVRAFLRAYKKLPTAKTAAYVEALAEASGTGPPPPDLPEARGLWMTWDMLREMHAAGMTIGGHTMSHPVLSRLSRAEQLAEITGCHERLEEELGAPVRFFAYPVGTRDAFNADTRDCLRQQGVVNAFSYYGGISHPNRWDDYDVRRIAIEQDTSFEQFRACVSLPWVA